MSSTHPQIRFIDWIFPFKIPTLSSSFHQNQISKFSSILYVILSGSKNQKLTNPIRFLIVI